MNDTDRTPAADETGRRDARGQDDFTAFQREWIAAGERGDEEEALAPWVDAMVARIRRRMSWAFVPRGRDGPGTGTGSVGADRGS